MENELKPFQAQEVGITETQMERFGITSPQQIVDLAKEINKYVSSNGLSETIQKKQYVLVEGWQFAAGLLGCFGRIVDYKNESDYEEITLEVKYKDWNSKPPTIRTKSVDVKRYKYFAQAEFVNNKGTVISNGFAMCTNEESAKISFDEYAVLSMAQTRALGKAARMSFAFLIKAAGYEPTPLEEMPDPERDENITVPQTLSEDVENEILVFTDAQQLADWANKQTEHHNNLEFLNLVKKQIKKLNNG